jgi:hypothetical protein
VDSALRTARRAERGPRRGIVMLAIARLRRTAGASAER